MRMKVQQTNRGATECLMTISMVGHVAKAHYFSVNDLQSSVMGIVLDTLAQESTF